MLTYGFGVANAGLYSAQDSVSESELSTWSFALDGHTFLMIRIGNQYQLAFDITNGQFSHWNLEGSTLLPSNIGGTYQEFVLLGGEDGTIYSLDPDVLTDDGEPFSMVLTGGIKLATRKAVGCFSLFVTGDRTTSTSASIDASTSDDNSKTWYSHGSQSISGGEVTEVVWRSMGTMRSPGRVFEITDSGVFANISAFDITTGPQDV